MSCGIYEGSFFLHLKRKSREKQNNFLLTLLMDTWKDKLIFDFFLTQKTLVSTYNLLGTVPDFPR